MTDEVENALLADPPVSKDASDGAVHTCQPKPSNNASEASKTSDGAPELTPNGTNSNENAKKEETSKPADVAKTKETVNTEAKMESNETVNTEEKMELDDPEIFGPFSKSQLEPVIQTDADQGHLDCFIDNMTMLKTAIGNIREIRFKISFSFLNSIAQYFSISDLYVALNGPNTKLAAAVNIISNPRHQAMLVLERFGTHWVPRCATIALGPILRKRFSISF